MLMLIKTEMIIFQFKVDISFCLRPIETVKLLRQVCFIKI